MVALNRLKLDDTVVTDIETEQVTNNPDAIATSAAIWNTYSLPSNVVYDTYVYTWRASSDEAGTSDVIAYWEQDSDKNNSYIADGNTSGIESTNVTKHLIFDERAYTANKYALIYNIYMQIGIRDQDFNVHSSEMRFALYPNGVSAPNGYSTSSVIRSNPDYIDVHFWGIHLSSGQTNEGVVGDYNRLATTIRFNWHHTENGSAVKLTNYFCVRLFKWYRIAIPLLTTVKTPEVPYYIDLSSITPTYESYVYGTQTTSSITFPYTLSWSNRMRMIFPEIDLSPYTAGEYMIRFMYNIKMLTGTSYPNLQDVHGFVLRYRTIDGVVKSCETPAVTFVPYNDSYRYCRCDYQYISEGLATQFRIAFVYYNNASGSIEIDAISQYNASGCESYIEITPIRH